MSGSSGTPDPIQEQELQAAEYVMGSLPATQARAVEVLAMSDVGMAASIAAWEARLAPLAELVPPAEPPASLWERLALAAGIERSAAVVAFPGGPARRERPWQRAVFWQGATALAAAVALLLLVRTPPAPPAPLLAALSPYGQPGATFLVRVAADGTAVIVAVGTAPVPTGRSLELWALASGSSTPTAIGLLPASGQVRLSVPRQPGMQLLVSQEPPGGSPTNLPTGPVVYAGLLTDS